MNEQQFIGAIRSATGKELGTDYGFIPGTQTPYTAAKGQLSVTNQRGFVVWKGSGLQRKERSMKSTSIRRNLKAIIEFLNEP